MTSAVESSSPQPSWCCCSQYTQPIVNAVHDVYKSARSCIDPFIPQCVKEFDIIQNIVFPILAVLAGVFFCAVHESWFLMGFIISRINPAMMNKWINKICDIWNMKHMREAKGGIVKEGIVKTALVAAALWGWTFSIPAAAFFIGGKMNLLIQRPDAQEKTN